MFYKARLVARGFEQNKECFDAYDLYAPVAELETFRIFVAVATKLGFRIYQMDVCRAFLNSEIQENVYLQVPEGVELEKGQPKFCKLNKTIYGLRELPNIGTRNLMLS